MTNPYRALCAELLDELDLWSSWHDAADLKDRAGSALDLTQPESVVPTDEELYELWEESGFESDRFARAVLAKRGHPTPQPMADGEVAELTARLRAIRNDYGVKHSADCQRAADLLERLASDNAGLTAAAECLWADNVSLLDN
jgi:hypothetical protein